MTRAPAIGISGIVKPVDGADRAGVNAAYVRSVVAAGGRPYLLSPLADPAHAADLLEPLDGLLLTGGDDLDPARYGAARHPATGGIDPARDQMEFALYAAARAQTKPVLAICRGLQLVNVAHGGTLVQDLPTERPGPIAHRAVSARDARTHAVRLAEGTRTATALGAVAARVNSFHHQAIARLGDGLVPTGWSDDDLIEAVEAEAAAWMVAVQWHPEEHWREADAPDQRLFRAFITEAARRP